MHLYLDCNAHHPMGQKALQAFINANNNLSGHGHASSPSLPGRKAAIAIEESREKIAQLLQVDTNQIVFTSTCTFACEWAVWLLANLKDNFWMTPAEHPAIKQAAKKFCRNINTLELDDSGTIFQLDCKPAVICIHMQNEIGVIQPIEKIKTDILLSDMSQSCGKIKTDLTNVDIGIFGGHKFGGSVSTGFLYIKDPNVWKEYGTGSRYFFDRPGTPDVPGIVSTAVALEEAIETLDERTEKMIEFQNIIEPIIEEYGYEIIGKNAKRCPNTTFVHLTKGKGLALMMALGERNIHVGLGSACGSMYAGQSPLMDYMGKKGNSHDYMRISQWGEYGEKEAKKFVEVFHKAASK